MAVFDAVICKYFSVHVKKHRFLIFHGMVLTHALWNETFLYPEVSSSFLVNTVQTLSKSVYNCQSYWQKFRGTFLWPTVYINFLHNVCCVIHSLFDYVTMCHWLDIISSDVNPAALSRCRLIVALIRLHHHRVIAQRHQATAQLRRTCVRLVYLLMPPAVWPCVLSACYCRPRVW